MSEPETYYALLQVDPAAEPEVIESAFRRLARKYHPDVNASPEASARMRAINLAYATLSNPSRRAIYDRQLRQSGIKHRLGARARTSVAADLGTRFSAPTPPAEDAPTALQRYRRAAEPLEARAAGALRRWAAEWADCLDAVVAGDPGGRRRAAETGQRCLAELTDCLAGWETLVPPPVARRLSDLGAACLKLELALVRGTLSFADEADFSVLQPLAGLAERIGALTRTIAAEAAMIARMETLAEIA